MVHEDYPGFLHSFTQNGPLFMVYTDSRMSLGWTISTLLSVILHGSHGWPWLDHWWTTGGVPWVGRVVGGGGPYVPLPFCGAHGGVQDPWVHHELSRPRVSRWCHGAVLYPCTTPRPLEHEQRPASSATCERDMRQRTNDVQRRSVPPC